ncbi:hypothetical protein D3C71_862750 [compost metagenome]
MDGGLLNARVDRRGIDVEAVELGEDARLARDRYTRDFDAFLACLRQSGLVAVQQEGTRLGSDTRVGPLSLHTDDGAQVVRYDPPFEIGLFRFDVVEKLLSHFSFVKRFEAQAQVDFVLLVVGEVG